MIVDAEQAKELLLASKVVAIPTETVYGLAARFDSFDAVSQIFALKGRPASNPLIVHVGSQDVCLSFAASKLPGLDRLISAFWPGPLTVVLPIKEERILPVVRANLATCAFRMPNHHVTLELLQHIPPLVAPSANKSGSPSSTHPAHIEHDFGSSFPVLDGGACQHGLESTIVVHQNDMWHIARLGALSQEKLAACLGYLPPIAKVKEGAPICPGQLFRHYSPKARLLLDKGEQLPDVVGFDDRVYPGLIRLFSLGNSQNAEEAAFRLYDALRQLDQLGVKDAWVDMDFPDTGVWKTIRERLFRASRG